MLLSYRSVKIQYIIVLMAALHYTYIKILIFTGNNMKNLSLKKFIITPIALSVLAGTAMAQDVEQGWYVEGNVGQAKGYETQTQLQKCYSR